MRKDLVDALTAASGAPGTSLAQMALLIARIEYPRLDPAPYLSRLDALGEEARLRIEHDVDRTGDTRTSSRIASLNAYLFDQQGFVGNRDRYEDPRNSCLNEVLDRRTGIPITLSLVYMEVAKRAGLEIEGVNFPGHFLVRCLERGGGAPGGLIIDPFHAGALLNERKCRILLEKHVGSEMAFNRALLEPAKPAQIVIRMLLNLKRIYVHMRSFAQARDITEVLLALDPSALNEVRDRGLLAYHLNDLSAALQDLQTYLKLSGMGEVDDETKEERKQIWEHVKTLRRRLSGLN
jgi:regulator of sirC expression with transglutaminase-like and TPR domain